MSPEITRSVRRTGGSDLDRATGRANRAIVALTVRGLMGYKSEPLASDAAGAVAFTGEKGVGTGPNKMNGFSS